MRPNAATPSRHTLHALNILNMLWLGALLATTGLLLLTGCAMGPRLIPSASQGVALKGNIHGGQQPVVGSHVYLLAAGADAYGSASVSLLETLNIDEIGAYVVSGADGTFTITGEYACTPGQQVYLLARGGDSGGGPNSAIGLMAVVGACPVAGSFAASIPFIEINEVSTVAAAYALSGFATTDTAIANDEDDLSNTTPAAAHTGLANAFATASNLVDLGTGIALATTPAGNGVVPQATINTLANILAACINTADPIAPTNRPGVGNPHTFSPHTRPIHSDACNTLFSAALDASENAPSSTASAAINIAHFPTANVSTLYTLASRTPPFTPALTGQPNDFTLTLAFTPSQLNVQAMAIDASGDLWYVFNQGIAELTPLGAEVAGSPFPDNSLSNPFSMAIDSAGDIWVPDYGNQTLTEFSSAGTVLQSNSVTGFDYPTGIAIDPSGNLWFSNLESGAITETNSFGTLIASYNGGGLIDPFQILSDGSGNLWLPNPNGADVALFHGTGTPFTNSPLSASGLSPAYGFNVAGLDSSGNFWTINSGSGSIGGISIAGTALPGTPFGGTTPSNYYPQPGALTLDGLSNIFAVINYEDEDCFHTGAPQPLSAHPYDYAYQLPTLYGFTSSGTSLLGSSFVLSGAANAIAPDPSGNLWYSVPGVGFYEIVGLAAPVITPTAAAVLANKIATLP